jgi:hypothetical protein
MQTPLRLFGTLALGAVLAACGNKTAPLDEDLARDLEQVGGGSLELAPTASGTQVMSAVELSPKAPAAAPAPAPARARAPRPAPRPKQQVARAPSPKPRAVDRAPDPAPAPEPARAAADEVEMEAPAPSPASAPQGAGPAPPGGWRSVDDVIRNSRVPITP